LNGEVLTLSAVSSAGKMDLATVLKSEDERGYGYDVQYLLRGRNLDLDGVRDAIGKMGDSMVVVGDDKLIKVHIHVHDPGIPISYGARLGVISEVVVENMQDQSEDYIAMRGDSTADESASQVNPGDIAVVAVAPGDGLGRVLRDLGVAMIVAGGQTMNPSTEELLQAAENLPTDKIVILPNNKNILLAAEQAAQIANNKGDRHVVVIPTRTVPQGITAMLSFTPDGDFDTVVNAMQAARDTVATGEVTTATRSVEIDGVNVQSGQVIGLVDGKLSTAGNDIPTVVRDLLKQLAADREVITMYYGDHVSEGDANQLAASLRKDYPDQEFDVIWGGQPYYHYILSGE